MDITSEISRWIAELTVTDFICIWAICVLITFMMKRERYSNLPPGPFAWPLVGNICQVGKYAHLYYDRLRRKYGDVYRLYFGSQLVIVVSGKEFVNQCLNARSVLFSMRPDFFSSRFILNGNSLAFAKMNVATHMQYKKIAMAALKNTEESLQSTPNGVKANKATDEADGYTPLKHERIEGVLAEEAVIMGRKLLKLSEEYDVKYSNPSNHKKKTYKDKFYEIVLSMCANTMVSVLFGKRYYSDDDQLDFLTQIMIDFHNIDKKMMLLNFFPILQKVWKRPINTYIGLCKAYSGLVDMHVAARKKKLTRNQEDASNVKFEKGSVTDFLLESRTENGTIDNENVTSTVAGDLLGAGIDTMTLSLMWLMVYFSVYPILQKKAHKEVESFVQENGRLPNYTERVQLPYTMAFIAEMFRHSSVIPFAIPHTPVQDTTLGGYFIPHGAVLLISLRSINREPEFWGDHEDFRPERFIQNEKFNKILADKVNVFGAGRRRCAGSNLAQMMIFVFATALLRSFQFYSGGKGKRELPTGVLGISLSPETVNVKVRERNAWNQE